MSHTDDTLQIRPPLPVVCGILDVSRQPGPSYHRATCSRCGRDVSINTRVEASMLEAELARELVCLMCWSSADQTIVRSYRDVGK